MMTKVVRERWLYQAEAWFVAQWGVDRRLKNFYEERMWVCLLRGASGMYFID